MNEGVDNTTIHLNVGGIYFVTRRCTLMETETFFSGALRSHPDDGELFIDRDPTHFRHILNWLRGVRNLPDDELTLSDLWWEADYYCMTDMKAAIRSTRPRYSVPQILTSMLAEMRQRNRG